MALLTRLMGKTAFRIIENKVKVTANLISATVFRYIPTAVDGSIPFRPESEISSL